MGGGGWQTLFYMYTVNTFQQAGLYISLQEIASLDKITVFAIVLHSFVFLTFSIFVCLILIFFIYFILFTYVFNAVKIFFPDFQIYDNI